MNKIKEFLQYQLIATKALEITFYDLVVIAVIIIITVILLFLIKKLIYRQVKRERIERGLAHSVFQIIKYVVWVVIIVVILQMVGLKLTLFLAGSAALLVGIGLGLQQIFNDILSGFFILFERNLKVDDIVQLEDGTVGKVISVGFRTSKIKTRDNIIMIVPNSKFINDRVINWTHIEGKTRFHVDVGVAYGTDVQKVKQVLLDCARKHPEITNDPLPFVRFLDFSDSALVFQLFFFTENTFMVENTKSDLRFLINQSFKDNGIQIPFPQRDVHIKNP